MRSEGRYDGWEKNRLEAFSDGVLAIIITIMVLEASVPHGDDWSKIAELGLTFVSYVLSFIYVAIYWNNHHHLLHTVAKVKGRFSGRTRIFSSGSRSYPSSRGGWVRTTSQSARSPRTASCS
ncbi:MAG: TMEM175 family protein [Polyangiaceae bacterium]